MAPEGETVVGINPLEKPPFSKGWQGSPKELCTTEWFYGTLAPNSIETKAWVIP
jgi:hypothetical protein